MERYNEEIALKKYLSRTRNALLLAGFLTSLGISVNYSNISKSNDSKKEYNKEFEYNDFESISKPDLNKLPLIFDDSINKQASQQISNELQSLFLSIEEKTEIQIEPELKLLTISDYLESKENFKETLVAGVPSLIKKYLRNAYGFENNQNANLTAGVGAELSRFFEHDEIRSNINRLSDMDAVSLEDKDNFLSGSANAPARDLSKHERNMDVFSEEFQHFVEVKSLEYGVPVNLMRLIIDQESDGTWLTNGVISISKDYGLCQINESNFDDLYNVFGYTEDDIQYDPYKNLECALYIIKTIFAYYGYDINLTEEEMLNVCGTYNGWITWQDKEMSLNYVEDCRERLKEYKREKALKLD